ncbi:DUF6760 family protein [Myxacorys almedinensis]|uniref:DUF6760 domain-containing protein n=1 Tax=Myxacorys almedinensis A TaxID=2690445 RepID=A0A8J7Z4W6_9CYAN|nr:DUF6760 family protein [Myxacorys almedinensis]NDJ16468.1 hypothetical protein [Myxacorys almedinensis A]
MPGRVSGGASARGGVTRYPSDRLREEVAYLAYYFHWSYDQIMTLAHRERQQWVAEVARINQRSQDQSARSEPW